MIPVLVTAFALFGLYLVISLGVFIIEVAEHFYTDPPPTVLGALLWPWRLLSVVYTAYKNRSWRWM